MNKVACLPREKGEPDLCAGNKHTHTHKPSVGRTVATHCSKHDTLEPLYTQHTAVNDSIKQNYQTKHCVYNIRISNEELAEKCHFLKALFSPVHICQVDRVQTWFTEQME